MSNTSSNRSEEQKQRNRESAKRFQREHWSIVKERQKLWRMNNPDLVRSYSKKYREKTTEERRLKGRIFMRKWRKENPLKHRAQVNFRRAAKLLATPPWVDKKAIMLIYENCPDGYHVDHIIPLNHDLVCGLNVPWNLQYLSGPENCAKNNKFDPQHWHE